MESTNSLERMLQVVDLIEVNDSPVPPGDLMARLGLTRSTLYRYLKILSDAGLITSFPGVGFALGPRIAELDFRMRNRDPLIIASRPVMSELVAAIGVPPRASSWPTCRRASSSGCISRRAQAASPWPRSGRS
jgi:DNA-binding IclR family transcriptional regulator